MTEHAGYTASELLAVMAARLLEDGQTVFAGVGVPLLAATLAQRLHAPTLTILFEGGGSGRSSWRDSCRPRPTSSAAPVAPTWCCRSRTCSCCFSAATSTSDSWAVRRSTASGISTAPISATRGRLRSACPAPAAATTSPRSRR